MGHADQTQELSPLGIQTSGVLWLICETCPQWPAKGGIKVRSGSSTHKHSSGMRKSFQSTYHVYKEGGLSKQADTLAGGQKGKPTARDNLKRGYTQKLWKQVES